MSPESFSHSTKSRPEAIHLPNPKNANPIHLVKSIHASFD